ncbi:MAG: hypothetical protein KGQ59_01225 [Bdellovibrionales bacterium]|nr:hypothetical protein [Bdellovibrionales bacterium]
MIKNLTKASVYTGMKRLTILSLVAYGILTTVLLLKLDPRPLVIGIDPYGTRIVGSYGDSILKAEKENLLKRFLIYLYSYDETNFDDRISEVGEFMNSELWERKRAEFISISSRLKTEPLTQKARITDIREIDETHYEADLELAITNRLKKASLKLRVSVELKASPRRSSKPYPWEVITYDEQTI